MQRQGARHAERVESAENEAYQAAPVAVDDTSLAAEEAAQAASLAVEEASLVVEGAVEDPVAAVPAASEAPGPTPDSADAS